MCRYDAADAEQDLQNVKHSDEEPAVKEPAQPGKPHQVSHVCADYKDDTGNGRVPGSGMSRFHWFLRLRVTVTEWMQRVAALDSKPCRVLQIDQFLRR